MWQKKSLLVCLLSYFVLESEVNAASIITPCKYGDVACLKSSTQEAIPLVAAGLPDLGVPPLDPTHIDSMTCDKNDLHFTLQNTHVTGPKGAKVVEVTHDADKKRIKLVIDTPIYITGTYDASGKLLFIPVVGHGDFELKTDDIRLTVDLKYKIEERDGKKYWKITGFNYSFDLKEKCYLKFDNLFGGDEVLAKPMNDILDSNWREVTLEFGGCIVESPLLSSYVEDVNKLFHAVPTDELQIA